MRRLRRRARKFISSSRWTWKAEDQNLVEHPITAEQAARIEQAMRAAFEEAEVDAAEIERLEPAMTNDPKNRHVLAAASVHQVWSRLWSSQVETSRGCLH